MRAMSREGRRDIAAVYFAAQATAGALWWMAVFVSDDVRRLTLAEWDVGLVAALDIPLFVVGSAVTAATRSTRWAVVTASWTVAVTLALTLYALATRDGGWGAFLMVPAAGATVAAATVIASGHVPVGWFFVGPFSFRPAPARSRVSNVVHSLAQLVTFWSAFFVLLAFTLAWTERRLHLDAPVLSSPGVAWFGLAILAVGSAVGVWACLSMAIIGEGTPLPSVAGRRLVVTGPYRFVRNAMALAGAAQTVGAGLLLGSWTVVFSAVLGGLLWNIFIRPAEEADLTARFGDAYNAYRARVRCWVPVRPQPPREHA